MKTTIAATLLFAAIGGSNAFADESCHGVDLRRPELNRPYTQIFLNADGQQTDSAQCASFSSALLWSQQLGISINPVDAAFQNSLSILLRTDKNLAAVMKTNKHAGYCKQAAVDAYFKKKHNGFIQAFNDFIRRLNPNVDAHGFSELSAKELRKIAQWLNTICGERIQIPSSKFSDIDKEPGDSSSRASLMDDVDRSLDQGKFVSYTHDYHAVTIVGRTKDCRYIIQDSIPESAWDVLGGVIKPGDVYKDTLSADKDRAQITFEKQFFQYWPRAILLKHLQRIGYAL